MEIYDDIEKENIKELMNKFDFKKFDITRLSIAKVENYFRIEDGHLTTLYITNNKFDKILKFLPKFTYLKYLIVKECNLKKYPTLIFFLNYKILI
ncbi:MAG: hypothetical protein HWN67_06420 [Candidatus Helarchaeota archaeon]|nr:hypothetical protein [Candidatus Helarchaeota archaeon]